MHRCTMPNVLKLCTFLFLFSNKMLVIRAGIHKMLVRLANREDYDQSDLGLHCSSRHFLQTICIQNFRTSIIYCLFV